MEISTFYFTAAGAAATLMGLMFIALQFNLERRASETRWRALARATFTTFAIVFLSSMFTLIPFPDEYHYTQVIFVVLPLLAIYLHLNAWWPQRRSRLTLINRIHALSLVGLPLVLFGAMIVYAVRLPDSTNPLDIQIPEAVLSTLLFMTAMRNSWELVLQAGLFDSAP